MEIRKGLVIVLVMLGLVGCGKEELEEVSEVTSSEYYDEDEGGMEEYRVTGDRLMEVPVLGEEERDKRVIKQYELIDRPIILNTLKYVEDFDVKHENFFKGVRLVKDISTEDLKEESRIIYRKNLGDPMHEDVVKIYDIKEEYPYVGDDFKSYYSTIVKGLEEEVFIRARLYDILADLIEKDDFDGIRETRAIRGMVSIIRSEKSLIEQYRPYIQEMDRIIKGKREMYGLEEVEYTKINDEAEDVAKYIIPEPITLQEIKLIDIDEDDFYGRIDELEGEDED